MKTALVQEGGAKLGIPENLVSPLLPLPPPPSRFRVFWGLSQESDIPDLPGRTRIPEGPGKTSSDQGEIDH